MRKNSRTAFSARSVIKSAPTCSCRSGGSIDDALKGSCHYFSMARENDSQLHESYSTVRGYLKRRPRHHCPWLQTRVARVNEETALRCDRGDGGDGHKHRVGQ